MLNKEQFYKLQELERNRQSNYNNEDTRLLNNNTTIHKVEPGSKKLWYIPRQQGNMIYLDANVFLVNDLEPTTVYLRDNSLIPQNYLPQGVYQNNYVSKLLKKYQLPYVNMGVETKIRRRELDTFIQNLRNSGPGTVITKQMLPSLEYEPFKENLSSLRFEFFKKFPLNKPNNNNKRVVFPVVEIHTKKTSEGFATKDVILNSQNQPTYKVFWFITSEYIYDKVFKPLEENPNSKIGGKYLFVSFPLLAQRAGNNISRQRQQAVLNMTAVEVDLHPNFMTEEYKNYFDSVAIQENYTSFNAAMSIRDFAYFTDEQLEEYLSPLELKIKQEMNLMKSELKGISKQLNGLYSLFENKLELQAFEVMSFLENGTIPTQQTHQVNQGFPQQPNQGFTQQPNQGFTQQPNQGFPQQPSQGFPQQPNQGFNQQSNQGFNQQQNQGFNQQQNQGFPPQNEINK